MTAENENRQQNVPSDKKRPPTSGGFKTGYDKRRWLNGRGKKSPEQKEGEEILLAVIWEELSREFIVEGKDIYPKEQQGEIDALRLMVRNMIKKDAKSVMERIAGKVTEKHELSNPDGSLKPEEMKPSEIAERVVALLKAKDANGN